ncbi:MAG: AAA family ATPase [Chloroflexi bacterium]|nr:AAA family ATPase [Chloroflexota bacterium]
MITLHYSAEIGTYNLPESLWLHTAMTCAAVRFESWKAELRTLPETFDGIVAVQRYTTPTKREFVGREGSGAVYVALSRGRCEVYACADSDEKCQELVAAVRIAIPENAPEGQTIGVTVWSHGQHHSERYERQLDVPRWREISSNYAADTRAALEHLVALRPLRSDGRLILWYGLPGTGKSWALRALAYEWRAWCRLHYISDPEVFLGPDPAYLLQVALGSRDKDDSDEEEGGWRLIVLEDAGEMLSVDAKERVGQALGRLLNLTDGILGQGSKAIVLITTNEELGALHPAVQRPGRSLANVAFEPLSSIEAQGWLHEHGTAVAPQGSRTLAELFGILDGQPMRPTRQPAGFSLPIREALGAKA